MKTHVAEQHTVQVAENSGLNVDTPASPTFLAPGERFRWKMLFPWFCETG